MITNAQAWGRPVRLGPYDFNLTDRDYVVTDIDGWESSLKPDAVIVGRGGGAGSVASGDWLPVERPLTISGLVVASREMQRVIRSDILRAFPIDAEVELLVAGIDEPDQVAFVQRYDSGDRPRLADHMEFVLPLVMLDPYKYAAEAVSGSMGAYFGATWYEPYESLSGWKKRYVKVGAAWYNTYTPTTPAGPYPPSVTLSSDASATSERIMIDVHGPLVAGWYLSQETTPERRLWVQSAVAANQVVHIDCREFLADIDGGDATTLLFGDTFTFEPGSNTYRLNTKLMNNDAWATVTARPAYE